MTVSVDGVAFIKTKFSSLDGKTTVGWAEEDSDFEIRADLSGVYFKGTMKMRLSTMKGLQDWAGIVSDAWKEHTRLTPKLTEKFNSKKDVML